MSKASSTFNAFDGAGYELQMGRWSRRLAPHFMDFSEVLAAERVLDVGCGTGSLSFELAKNPSIASIFGIDLVPAYVEYATSLAQGSRVDFRIGDACALPFPDGWFDHSLSSLVLQFIPDPDRAVLEMRRVTRSGGSVCATTWNTRGGLIIHRIFFDTASACDPSAVAWRARMCARRASQPHGLVQLWRDAGLMNVRLDSIAIEMEYRSFDDFWTSLAGRNGPYAEYVGTLAADTRARLRDLICAAYLDGDPDGLRSYMASAWAVKGSVP